MGIPQYATTPGGSLPASLTLAQLQPGAGGQLVQTPGTTVAADPAGGLIVLKKDDLNSILTSKPAILLGREIVSHPGPRATWLARY